MRHLIAAALLFLPTVANPLEIVPQENGTVVITLTVEEAVECLNGGGCIILPYATVTEIIKGAAQNLCGRAT